MSDDLLHMGVRPSATITLIMISNISWGYMCVLQSNNGISMEFACWVWSIYCICHFGTISEIAFHICSGHRSEFHPIINRCLSTQLQYENANELFHSPQMHLNSLRSSDGICISKLSTIGSDNGLSPGRRQAIISTSAGLLLIGPSGTNFSEILIEIHIFSFKKMHLKMSSGKIGSHFVLAWMC